MCNHYRSDPEWRTANEGNDWSQIKIRVRFDQTSRPNEDLPEHVYPARRGEILAMESGAPVAWSATWMFLPQDYKGSLKAYTRGQFTKGCNNCRSERADTAKMWKPVTSNRCLIPLAGFFEYAKEPGPDGKKVEHEFTRPGQPLFFAAGLFGWSDPEEGRQLTFTMLTKEPGGDTASIGHHRQPVILLDADDVSAWLDPVNPTKAFSERVDPFGTFDIRAVERKSKAVA